jgi:hypothetical protein
MIKVPFNELSKRLLAGITKERGGHFAFYPMGAKPNTTGVCLAVLLGCMLAVDGGESTPRISEPAPKAQRLEGMALSGAARVATAAGTVLRLVPAQFGKSGSAFSYTRVSTAKFSSSFSFRFSNCGSTRGTASGGDGFVFVVQPDLLGAGGGGLGYLVVTNTVGVEFDIFQNPERNDPDSSHVGIDVAGSVTSLTTAPVVPDMKKGDRWFAWIDYDQGRLELRLSQNDVRPSGATLSADVDIPKILNAATGHLGFTASTGWAWADEDILSWEIRSETNVVQMIETTLPERKGDRP